jgi:hypothetical protein
MLWLLTVSWSLVSGYAVLQLCGISTRNLAADVALAWFCGTGWYTFASCVALFVLGLEPSLWESVAILAFPVATAVALRRRLQGGIQTSIVNRRTTRWWPWRYRWLWVAPAGMVVVVLSLVVLHAKNTPTNTDDAIRLRAHTPMLVYQGHLSPAARSAIFSNGSFMSFGPLPIWQLRGTIHHFDVNYFIVTNVVFLFALIYALCSSRGVPEQGLGTVFLLTTMPLFVYHAASTYLDALYGVMFGGALFFLALEAQADSEPYRRCVLLFVYLAAGIKHEGEIVAITTLTVFLVMLAARCLQGKRFPWRCVSMGVAPLVIYLVVKNVYSSNPLLVGAARVLEQYVGYDAPGGQTAIAAVAAPNSTLAWRIFWDSLFSSGNFGIVFYIFGIASVYYWRTILNRQLIWPMAALALVFAEVLINALIVNPQWTVDMTTVHRSLVAVAMGCAIMTGLLPDARTLGQRTGEDGCQLAD